MMPSLNSYYVQGQLRSAMFKLGNVKVHLYFCTCFVKETVTMLTKIYF